MAALESRTLDSKIEMDILDALDEIKAYNGATSAPGSSASRPDLESPAATVGRAPGRVTRKQTMTRGSASDTFGAEKWTVW
ncbi:hypothetical protein JL722_5557 [Aureococcus anophagefferens]|nr:hypothetical protein JL722_5557 [Aureococcus anophagefferens]